jgi:aspartate/methionine/tyrosine aminotransferase
MIEAKLAGRVSQWKGSLLIQLQREAEAAEQSGKKITWLLRGEPDFDTPRHIVEAGKKAIDQGFSHYTGAEGVLPLREGIAERVRTTSGMAVDPTTDVIVTTGATMGLYVALMALLDDGDEVIVPEPYYGPYARMVELAGGRLVRAPLANVDGRLSLDVEAIAEQVSPCTKAVLINSPMNPTGTVFTRDELTRLGELAVERDLVIISDECYDAIVFDEHRFATVAALAPEFQARTIIVNSFSKTYAMTGWRLGYNVAPKALTQGMYRVFSQSGRCAAAFTQQAGLAAVRGPQEVVATMVAEYARRREIVVAGLREIGLPHQAPEGTFYVFPDFVQFGLSSVEVARLVLDIGQVAVTPGLFFGPKADTYIRLSFAASDGDIQRGLDGLRATVAELRTGSAAAVAGA